VRWLLLGYAAFAALIAGPAAAADMPVKMPVLKAPPVAPYNWTGFYVGINGGGGWSRDAFTVLETPATTFDATQGNGAVAGGYAGFNYQLSPWFLVGVEGAGSWANIKLDPIDCTVAQTALCSSDVKSLASIRGRAGLVLERAMVYVAAGWGFADIRYDRVLQPGGVPFTSGASATPNGFSAATGIEIAFNDYLIGRFQYDYYDFGATTYGVGVLSNTANVDVRTRVQTLTLGLAVKFGGGPVVAKY
jgi:outer membrane immunogenic protein